jgi:glutathione peroxidase
MDEQADSLYNFSANDIDGHSVDLKKYRGKVILVVNVASGCGFTPQYAGLQDLYEKYASQGFEILGFPCNQFGGQEPLEEGAIKIFCHETYQVTFPMFSKVMVNGRQAHPLFQFLREHAKGLLGSTAIKWNFTKFLIDHTGYPIKRFGPRVEPIKMASPIKRALSAKNKFDRRSMAIEAKKIAQAEKQAQKKARGSLITSTP